MAIIYNLPAEHRSNREKPNPRNLNSEITRTSSFNCSELQETLAKPISLPQSVHDIKKGNEKINELKKSPLPKTTIKLAHKSETGVPSVKKAFTLFFRERQTHLIVG